MCFKRKYGHNVAFRVACLAVATSHLLIFFEVGLSRASAMSLIGGIIVDYELTGSMRVEGPAGWEETKGFGVVLEKQGSPFPRLHFPSPFGVVRLYFGSTLISLSMPVSAADSFIPDWRATSVENTSSGVQIPLVCQALATDKGVGVSKPAREQTDDPGAKSPASASPDIFFMNCLGHNIGSLFASGYPFGAEVTRRPLSTRLTQPGSTVCLTVPGTWQGAPANVRICVTAHAAQARFTMA